MGKFKNFLSSYMGSYIEIYKNPSICNSLFRVPLKEDFFNGFRIDKKYVEVYKNPAKREVDGIYKDSLDNGVRIGVDAKNNIFVWIEDILHDSMQKALENKFMLRFEYTKDRPSLFLSSGETKKNFDEKSTKILLSKFKILFPNIKDIRESTGKFQIVHDYK